MILITGGAFQGKTEYALNLTKINADLVVDGAKCKLEDIFTIPMLVNFHLYIERMLKEDKEICNLVDELLVRNPDIIILVDELGCGVVPIEPFDRLYRETVGRLCCQIAREAQEVHRIICGVGIMIKEVEYN